MVILYGDMMVMDIRMLADWSVSSAFVDTALLNKAISFSLIVWDRAEIGSGLTAILNATMFMFTVFNVAHFRQRRENFASQDFSFSPDPAELW